MQTSSSFRWLTALLSVIVSWGSASLVQAQRQGPPPVQSPVVAAGEITFRVRAAKAESVRLVGGDLPQVGQGLGLTKGENQVWEVVVKDVAPGTYRYRFDIDGVQTNDPTNELTSESNGNTWSLVTVPGAEWMDLRAVPHGALSEVQYFSNSLKRFRRMHVYTPPGYEKGSTESYPVFYLLHGAFDSDDSWSTVGRANYILDNLIADKKAVPMICVMPDGHTGTFGFGQGLPVDEFVKDFEQDIRPYIEANYRVKTDRGSRAIAGLSMGGAHTLEIIAHHLEDYAYVGVFSSGVFSLGGNFPGANNGPKWTEVNKAMLENVELRKGLRLFWFSIGKDDFLLQVSRNTVKMFREHGFTVEEVETDGGHTWINWQRYANEFAPKLFRSDATN